MEETITPSPEYLKGFNEGYQLAKELPDMADKFSSIKSESERTKGFQDGQKQFVLEKAKEQRPAWLKDKKIEKANKSKDLDKDIEP